MFFDTIFRSFSQPLPTEPENVAKPVRKTYGNDAIVRVLMRCSGKWLTVSDLAAAMGCSVGEASKRVKAAGRLVQTRKDGRRKLVRLRAMRMDVFMQMASEIETRGMY